MQYFKKYNAKVSLWYVSVLMGMSFFIHLIIPDQSPHVNSSDISITRRMPLFSCNTLYFRRNIIIPEQSIFETAFFGLESSYDKISILGKPEIIGDSVYFTSYLDNSMGNSKEKISYHLLDCVKPLYVSHTLYLEGTKANMRKDGEIWEYWHASGEKKKVSVAQLEKDFWENNFEERRRYLLGTDIVGRDLLSRLAIATRNNLMVVLLSAVLSLGLASFISIITQLGPSVFKRIWYYIVEAFSALPYSLWSIGLVLALRFSNFSNIVLAISIVLAIKISMRINNVIDKLLKGEGPYQYCLHSLSKWSMTKYILPNIQYELLFLFVSHLSYVSLLETGLSFLNIGLPAHTPSFGIMLREGLEVIGARDSWHVIILPGLGISSITLAFGIIAREIKSLSELRDNK